MQCGRGEFNRLLRERYAEDPIFDLAAVTSTYPDGRRETFTLDGKTYESLVPAYTDDGGHLNAVGAVVRSRSVGTQRRRRTPQSRSAVTFGSPEVRSRFALGVWRSSWCAVACSRLDTCRRRRDS